LESTKVRAKRSARACPGDLARPAPSSVCSPGPLNSSVCSPDPLNWPFPPPPLSGHGSIGGSERRNADHGCDWSRRHRSSSRHSSGHHSSSHHQSSLIYSSLVITHLVITGHHSDWSSSRRFGRGQVAWRDRWRARKVLVRTPYSRPTMRGSKRARGGGLSGGG
jgi:hypothetical protein